MSSKFDKIIFMSENKIMWWMIYDFAKILTKYMIFELFIWVCIYKIVYLMYTSNKL